jgi:hypothetical protein
MVRFIGIVNRFFNKIVGSTLSQEGGPLGMSSQTGVRSPTLDCKQEGPRESVADYHKHNEKSHKNRGSHISLSRIYGRYKSRRLQNKTTYCGDFRVRTY